jgi:hypothetical protein
MTKPKTGPWVVEPPSKTTICTVTYPLPSTRRIHAIAISVNSGDGTDRSPVLSRRLRLQAIQQFCSTKMTLIKKYAVQLWADKTSENGRLVPIDNVLVVSQSSATAIPNIITDWRGVKIRIDVMIQVRSSDGSASTQSIYCKIESEKTISIHSNPKVYWQKLNSLLCQRLGRLCKNQSRL